MSTSDPLLSTSDFGQLRAFVAVAEVLNFSRAAETLGVSASALSQMVRGLEERVGVRLLHRNTRNVSLTEAGDRLFQRVRPAVHELGAAIGQTSELRARPAGIVRIHCFRTAADLFLRPLLRPFHDEYPDVVLDITLDDEVVDIVAGGYDVAIRIGEVIEQDMVAIKLGPDLRQIAVASPDYLAQRGMPQHPHDLASHRCIGWRWPGHQTPYKWEFVENGRWFAVAVGGPLITNLKDFGLQAAVDGLGIAFASEQLIAPHVAAGRLVPLLERWSAPFPGYYLCYPAQRQMAPPLRAFIDSVRSTARQAAI
ncbi:LysR family transcriptional regulator [Steroidobacter agaridevorans]|uniref:LysR family transcriptional regulator n=1 Tax=Steroidobacter agaridevorans TaxID=2695856 RepID=A0A829YQ80_9GAMM|nr:LysR family transcriptional regulator [Steroidobacter agaridevorans]GFE84922.1 LysR family transcriptional regulator [Steroidobacter agaridevorans]